MALFKKSILLSDITGSIAGSTFNRSKSGGTIQKRTYKKKNYVSNNFANKQALVYLQNYWGRLSQLDRNTWDNLAASLFYQSRVSNSENLSGYNLFVKHNYQTFRFGESIILSAPGPTASIFPIDINLVLDITSDEMVLVFVNPIPSNSILIIEATPLISQGIGYFNDKFVFVDSLINTSPADFNLWNSYNNRFPFFADYFGSTVKFELRFKLININTGFQSMFFSLNESTVISFDPDAILVINEMQLVGRALTFNEKFSINQYVLNLKGIGTTGGFNIWASLEFLRIASMDDSSHALVEWIMRRGQGVGNAVLIGTPTFFSGVGFIGTGSGCIDESFNPDVDGTGRFMLSDCLVGTLVANVGSSERAIGVIESGRQIQIRVRLTTIAVTLNSAINFSTWSQNVPGWYSLGRINSTSINQYIDTSLSNSFASNATSIPSLNLYSCALNDNGTPIFSPGTIISVSFAGSNFGAHLIQFKNSYDLFMLDFYS